ncbi:TPA: YdcH family protein [Salmonella enterica subsp. diarizonae serovar 61:l,v:z35]|uniref:YdcH family protein n=1 Tax=Citrobacter werkmanii TaxID=67827 RepID=UPI0012C022A0|nr:DUF465 domain-containing protein [Salmonella enterica subsp. enterica serovar Newport]
MFQEYRTLILRLKNEDVHFSVLFYEHNALDAEIKQREMISGFRDAETEILKKKKLQIKDELYRILKSYDAEK